jgi:predicted methyltransferase
MHHRFFLMGVLLLAGCGGASASGTTPTTPSAEATADPLRAAIDAPHRTEEMRARDRYRHPYETLSFFGVQPTSRVVELWPGGGWYTSILGPYLREEGHLTAVAARNRYLQGFLDFVAANPELYDQVEVVQIEPADGTPLSFGPDGSADFVLTFRNYHSWMNGSYEDEVLAAAFRVLRPGGVLGIVEHRGEPGMDREAMTRTGYVPEDVVIAAAEAAGFVLDERSEINANPADDHDHPNGVWSLPPALRGGDEGREEFLAIGESDRMTLRFRRPE